MNPRQGGQFNFRSDTSSPLANATGWHYKALEEIYRRNSSPNRIWFIYKWKGQASWRCSPLLAIWLNDFVSKYLLFCYFAPALFPHRYSIVEQTADSLPTLHFSCCSLLELETVWRCTVSNSSLFALLLKVLQLNFNTVRCLCPCKCVCGAFKIIEMNSESNGQWELPVLITRFPFQLILSSLGDWSF